MRCIAGGWAVAGCEKKAGLRIAANGHENSGAVAAVASKDGVSLKWKCFG